MQYLIKSSTKKYGRILLCVLFVMSSYIVTAQCKFKPIGHRGGSSYNFPENTLISLEQGFIEDIYAAEVDVQFTVDSVLVLMHDFYIDRTTNGTGYVRDLTWNYLKTLDAGSWKNEKFKGRYVMGFVPNRGIKENAVLGISTVALLANNSFPIFCSAIFNSRFVVFAFSKHISSVYGFD